jgi:hypothetical protein
MPANSVQDQCATKELSTLLIALYVLIDDHVVSARVGRGRQPLLSGSELITLAVTQALQGLSLRTPLDPISSQQPTVACPVPLPVRPVGLPQAAFCDVVEAQIAA